MCNFSYCIEISAIAIIPHTVNNAANIDRYYRRLKLMEILGCISTEKFTNDLGLIRQIKHDLFWKEYIRIAYIEL